MLIFIALYYVSIKIKHTKGQGWSGVEYLSFLTYSLLQNEKWKTTQKIRTIYDKRENERKNNDMWESLFLLHKETHN